jgi:hypothetical protein
MAVLAQMKRCRARTKREEPLSFWRERGEV